VYANPSEAEGTAGTLLVSFRLAFIAGRCARWIGSNAQPPENCTRSSDHPGGRGAQPPRTEQAVRRAKGRVLP